MRFLKKTCAAVLTAVLAVSMAAGGFPAALSVSAADDHETEIIPIGDQPLPAECFVYHTNAGGGITITDYVGDAMRVLIPSTINGKRVTNIVPSAFHWQVDSLTIPRYVQSFSDEGLAGPLDLTPGEHPMTEIRVSALNPNYKAVDGVLFSKDGTVLYKIPEGQSGTYRIPSGTVTLSENALVNCHSLTGLHMNDELSTFLAKFIGCESLSSLSNDTSRQFYTDGTCLYNPTKTVLLRTVPAAEGEIEVPSSVKTIENGALQNCVRLSAVRLPSGLETIGEAAFSGCAGVTSAVIPASVTSIGSYALAGMTALSSLQLSAGISTLPAGLVSGDSALQNVTVPNGVTAIEDGAFSDCSDLRTVEIPDSVTRMGEVHADGTIETLAVSGVFSGSEMVTLYGSEGSCAQRYAERYHIPFARERLQNLSTLSAETAQVGASVTLTGNASGGLGEYAYAFYYKKSTSTRWTSIGTPFTASSAVFKPGARAVYDVKAVVRDGNGTLVEKRFTLTAVRLTNTSSLSNADPGLGETVVITGSAEGGVGTCAYAFYYRKASASGWTTLGTPFSSATTASFQPGAEAAYQVKVVVKDASGKTEAKILSLQAHKLTNTSSLSSAAAVVGETVTITGQASGGVPGYTYTFFYKKSTSSKWNSLSGTDRASFKPGAAATYKIKVVVKDSIGKTAAVLLTVTATQPTELSNTSSLSKTKAVKGETILISGAASGGTAPYTYAYSYRKSGSSTWTKLSDGYVSDSSASFKVSYAVVYEIKVIVKDAKGKTATTILQVTVSTADPYEGPIL